MSLTKQAQKSLRRFIFYSGREIASKNLFFLLYVPLAVTGFVWGFVFPLMASMLVKFAANSWAPPGLKWLGEHKIIVALIPCMLFSMGVVPCLCRAILILMPDEFDDMKMDQ